MRQDIVESPLSFFLNRVKQSISQAEIENDEKKTKKKKSSFKNTSQVLYLYIFID